METIAFEKIENRYRRSDDEWATIEVEVDNSFIHYHRATDIKSKYYQCTTYKYCQGLPTFEKIISIKTYISAYKIRKEETRKTLSTTTDDAVITMSNCQCG